MGHVDDAEDLVETGLCVCCSDNEALFVMNRCGHVVFCCTCRRKAVYAALYGSAGASASSISHRRDLGSRELTRTELICPLCRTAGMLTAKSSYDGVMYEG